MQRAKAFFFVCAGVVLLVAAYALGARSVGAQLDGTITAAECLYLNGDGTLVVIGRTLYSSNGTYPPIPGTDPVIAVGEGGGGHILAMLANGDTYVIPGAAPGASWQFLRNAVGSSTAAGNASWGQVKARYR